ncbi:hypothetical protein HMPREF0262_02041 [Clostridium sp. ATCC 29733]|nr:hypothetical protein HMPREF0262_02041 [Clostridium sp. ATCC 29733]
MLSEMRFTDEPPPFKIGGKQNPVRGAVLRVLPVSAPLIYLSLYHLFFMK